MQDIVTLIAHFADFVYAPVKTLKNKYIFNKRQKCVYQNFLQYFVSKHSESCKQNLIALQ